MLKVCFFDEIVKLSSYLMFKYIYRPSLGVIFFCQDLGESKNLKIFEQPEQFEQYNFLTTIILFKMVIFS